MLRPDEANLPGIGLDEYRNIVITRATLNHIRSTQFSKGAIWGFLAGMFLTMWAMSRS